MFLPPFIFNDQTKENSHGFFLVNAGGRLERFHANPVMLDNHDLDRLIGRWLNLRVDGDLLIADPDFDIGIELGKERKGQVERGFLKGASPGIIVYAVEERLNAAAERYELYVTDWELFEGSTTPVPSNAGALTLKIYGVDGTPIADKDVKLHLQNIVKLSAESKAPGLTSNTKNMEKLTLTAAALVALGITDGADTNAISAAIVALHTVKNDLAAEVKAFKDAETVRLKADATAKVELAIKQGKCSGEKKESLIQLALDSPALFDDIVGNKPEKVTLSEKINEIKDSKIPAGREAWKLSQWIKEDYAGLQTLRAEQPELYAEIVARK